MVLALTVVDWSYSHSCFHPFLICASLVRPPGSYSAAHIHVPHPEEWVCRGTSSSALSSRNALVLMLSNKQGETRAIPKQAVRYRVCWEIHRFGWTDCFPATQQLSIVALLP